MKIALGEELRELDRRAVQEAGMPSLLLMENAGHAVANEAISLLADKAGNKKVVIFAGRGNNGGDALVAARHLINSGLTVRVFLLFAPEEFSPDAAVNFSILFNMQADIVVLNEEKDWDKVTLHMLFADLIIDGLLGTGFKGMLEGSLRRAVELMNQSKKLVLAIDVPSGLDVDSGQTELAVQATNTLTLVLPKLGLLFSPGRSYVGKLSLAQIGLPKNLIDTAAINQTLITGDIVKCLLPIRSVDAHKGQTKAAVLAGAQGTVGAAALCAEAALRSGAGLVRLFTPESIAGLLAIKLTEVMVSGLPEQEGLGLQSDQVFELLGSLSLYDAVAIGPGLGLGEGTIELVCSLLEQTDRQLVLDADALNAMQGRTELFGQSKKVAVLTPHLGEMARLTGLTVAEIERDGVLRVARRFSIQWQSVVVLKGAPTVVAFPDGQAFVNSSGNQGMATAGSGDVLTGIIVGLLAQGLDPGAAAVCGVYLHGLAGDVVAGEGMIGLAAGDIIAALPRAQALVTGQVK